MTTEICFVRHGQTDFNYQGLLQGREDNPLNEEGMKQAKATADFLKNEKWDVIVSSPLIRAYDTAKYIAKATGIREIELHQDLVERHFGEISGKDYRIYVDSNFSSHWKEFEQDQDLTLRVGKAVEEIVQKHEHKRVIIVAHSHVIKAFLHHVDPETVNFRSKLHNACSNYVKLKDGKWELVRYNVADYITAP